MRTRHLSMLAVGFTIVGSVIGAGFASGQEIWFFFASQGRYAFAGVAVASVLLLAFVLLIARWSFQASSDSHEALLYHLAGPRAAGILATILAIFFWCGLTVMLAGSAALIPPANVLVRLVVTVMTAFLAYVVACQRATGLARANQLLMPLLVGFILYMAYQSHSSQPLILDVKSMPANQSWLLMAVLYAAFNGVMILVVIPPLAIAAGKRNAYVGMLFSGTILGVLLLLIVTMLQRHLPYQPSGLIEVPMLHIARSLLPQFPNLYQYLLWIALATTAFAATLGLWNYVEEHWLTRPEKSLFWLVTAAAILAQGGFARLVGVLYPFMGYVCLLLICFIFVRRLIYAFDLLIPIR